MGISEYIRKKREAYDSFRFKKQLEKEQREERRESEASRGIERLENIRRRREKIRKYEMLRREVEPSIFDSISSWAGSDMNRKPKRNKGFGSPRTDNILGGMSSNGDLFGDMLGNNYKKRKKKGGDNGFSSWI